MARLVLVLLAIPFRLAVADSTPQPALIDDARAAAQVVIGAHGPDGRRLAPLQRQRTSRDAPADDAPADGYAASVAGSALVMSYACDLGGTLSAAAEGWSDGRSEGGWPARALMGETPRASSVVIYFAAMAAVAHVAGRAVGPQWRPYLYGAIAAIEGSASLGNIATTHGICGVGQRSRSRNSSPEVAIRQ